MTRKYQHLTSGSNYNNVTVSVQDGIAPQVDGALDHLICTLGLTKSKIVCDAILAMAAGEGFVYEDKKAQAGN